MYSKPLTGRAEVRRALAPPSLGGPAPLRGRQERRAQPPLRRTSARPPGRRTYQAGSAKPRLATRSARTWAHWPNSRPWPQRRSRTARTAIAMRMGNAQIAGARRVVIQVERRPRLDRTLATSTSRPAGLDKTSVLSPNPPVRYAVAAALARLPPRPHLGRRTMHPAVGASRAPSRSCATSTGAATHGLGGKGHCVGASARGFLRGDPWPPGGRGRVGSRPSSACC